jgi:hypothetical protein
MGKESSWNYFFDNQERLMRENPGGYVVIKRGKLCGIYMDQCNADANAPKYGDDLLIIHLDPKGIKEYHLKPGKG